MVAPADIAQLAARLLVAPLAQTGLHYLEGPATYSPADVATAFAAALHRPVAAAHTPRAQWLPALRAMGFSAPPAESFANMTAATLDQRTPPPPSPECGPTTLQQYITELVQRPPQA